MAAREVRRGQRQPQLHTSARSLSLHRLHRPGLMLRTAKCTGRKGHGLRKRTKGVPRVGAWPSETITSRLHCGTLPGHCVMLHKQDNGRLPASYFKGGTTSSILETAQKVCCPFASAESGQPVASSGRPSRAGPRRAEGLREQTHTTTHIGSGWRGGGRFFVSS